MREWLTMLQTHCQSFKTPLGKLRWHLEHNKPDQSMVPSCKRSTACHLWWRRLMELPSSKRAPICSSRIGKCCCNCSTAEGERGPLDMRRCCMLPLGVRRCLSASGADACITHFPIEEELFSKVAPTILPHKQRLMASELRWDPASVAYSRIS